MAHRFGVGFVFLFGKLLCAFAQLCAAISADFSAGQPSEVSSAASSVNWSITREYESLSRCKLTTD